MGFASVYVATGDSGQIKVGMSGNLPTRMRQLTKTRGKPVRLIWATESLGWPLFVETAAHRLLAETHVDGEWFSATEGEAIAAVRKAVDLVLAGYRPRDRLVKTGRPVQYPERVVIPITFAERAKIRELLAPKEPRTDFVREAVEREIKRRERLKP